MDKKKKKWRYGTRNQHFEGKKRKKNSENESDRGKETKTNEHIRAQNRFILKKMKKCDDSEIVTVDYNNQFNELEENFEEDLRSYLLGLKKKGIKCCRLLTSRSRSRNLGKTIIRKKMKIVLQKIFEEGLIFGYCSEEEKDMRLGSGRFVVLITCDPSSQEEDEEDEDNVSVASIDSLVSTSSAGSEKNYASLDAKEENVNRMRREKEEKEREFNERMREKRKNDQILRRNNIIVMSSSSTTSKERKRKKKVKRKRKKKKRQKQMTNYSENNNNNNKHDVNSNVLSDDFDTTEDIDSMIDFIKGI